jgi:hypothetical protein
VRRSTKLKKTGYQFLPGWPSLPGGPLLAVEPVTQAILPRETIMSDNTAQIQEFYRTFATDEAMQEQYLKDPEAFLKASALPSAYVGELLEEMRSPQFPAETEGVAEAPILAGAKKGKPKITVSTKKWHGIPTLYTIRLNTQAVDDIAEGLLVVAGLAGMLLAADPEPFTKVTAGVLAGALIVESRAMKLVDRGNGVHYFLSPLLMATLGRVAPVVIAAQLVPFSN